MRRAGGPTTTKQRTSVPGRRTQLPASEWA
jgi:hypothetical protein